MKKWFTNILPICILLGLMIFSPTIGVHTKYSDGTVSIHLEVDIEGKSENEDKKEAKEELLEEVFSNAAAIQHVILDYHIHFGFLVKNYISPYPIVLKNPPEHC